MNQQKGITLIEMLAAITILSIVGIIIWNVLFQGLSFTNTLRTETQMQQEANLIVASLRKIHRSSDQYTIENSDDPNSSYIILQNSTNTIEYNNSHFIYQLYLTTNGGEQPITNGTPVEIKPKDQKNIKIKLIITNREKTNQQYEIQDYITRL